MAMEDGWVLGKVLLNVKARAALSFLMVLPTEFTDRLVDLL